MWLKAFTTFIILLLLIASSSFSQEKSIYVFKIAEEIDLPAWRKTNKAIEEAHKIEADIIFLKMNTYGGSVQYADSISEKIFRSKIPEPSPSKWSVAKISSDAAEGETNPFSVTWPCVPT